MQQALSHLVLSDRVIDQLGPAVNGGHSLFVYGPPGERQDGDRPGREEPARRRHRHSARHRAGRPPGAGLRSGRPRDPARSRSSDDLDTGDQPDGRWLRCRRPLVTVGGELTLHSLELAFDAAVGLLPGADPAGRQRRRAGHRRLRPPALFAGRAAQPLDHPAREPHRLPDADRPGRSCRCRSSSWWCSPPTSSRRTWSTRRSCAASTTRCSPRTRRSATSSRSSSRCCRERGVDYDEAVVDRLVTSYLPPAQHRPARLPAARPDRSRAGARRLPRRAAHAHRRTAGRRPARATSSTTRLSARPIADGAYGESPRGLRRSARLCAAGPGSRASRPRQTTRAHHLAARAHRRARGDSRRRPGADRRRDAACCRCASSSTAPPIGADDDGPPYAVEWTDENPYEAREIRVDAEPAPGGRSSATR